MKKVSASLGSALPDPKRQEAAAAPIPPPSVANKPAPGQTGPRGLSPRTTYSRVNTGAPPIPDAGVMAQKGVAPRGMEFLPQKVAEVPMSVTQRPTIQEMVKAAMAGTIGKVNITNMATNPPDNQEQVKLASDESLFPTAQIEKLANALDFVASTIKEADLASPTVAVGKGPGALEVSQATSSEKNIDAGELGSATPKHQAPTNPPVQSEQVQSGKADTGLETNDGMQHPAQPVDPWSNEKAKLSSLNRIMKVAHGKELSSVQMIRKLAEDAINPASVSGKKETPPDASGSEDKVPSQPSDVNKQMNMVGSNQSAIDYTKGEAKADPKSDVNKVLTEPALTSSTDKTLDKVLDHTGEAGVKISSSAIKVAAARARLAKLAECGKKQEGKKEKSSMMGQAPTTPQQATGVTPIQ